MGYSLWGSRVRHDLATERLTQTHGHRSTKSSTEEGDSTLEVTSKLTLKTGVVQIKDRPVGVRSGAVQAEGQNVHRHVLLERGSCVR